jgi:hypothetical protein
MEKLMGLLSITVVLVAGPVSAAPPPPPPSYVGVAEQLLTASREPTAKESSELFSKMIDVYVGKKLISSGQESWLSYWRAHYLNRKRLQLGFTEGDCSDGPCIAVVDTFDANSFSSTKFSDPRYVTRFTTYHFDDTHMIRSVEILEVNSFWRLAHRS